MNIPNGPITHLARLLLSGISPRMVSPFIVVAFLFALLAYQNTDAVHSHFQSAIQSPVDPTPTDTPVPPAPTDTLVPPVPTNTPVPLPPIATNTPLPTLPPVEAPPPTKLPTELPVAEQAPLPTAITPNNLQSGVEALPPPPLEEVPLTEVQSQGEQGFYIINEVALIDTVLQWFAWFWMCFGVAVILLIPLIFVFLQIRGKR